MCQQVRDKLQKVEIIFFFNLVSSIFSILIITWIINKHWGQSDFVESKKFESGQILAKRKAGEVYIASHKLLPPPPGV